MSAPSREEAIRAAFDAAGFTGAIIPEGGRTTLFASELEAVGRALLAERERAASEYARGLAAGKSEEREALYEHFTEIAVDAIRRCKALRDARALSGAEKEDDDGR